MSTRKTFFVFTLCFIITVCGNTVIVNSSKFEKCPLGSVWAGQELSTVHGRSTLDCMAICLRNADCEAFNICPEGLSEDAACQLLTDANSQLCVGLTTSSPDWRYVMPKPLDCLNGGTWDGAQCVCPIEFTGDTCNRYIRDCAEPFENGYRTTDYNGVYSIQPVGVPVPFQVDCVFTKGGVTKFLVRRVASSVSFNVDWATAKAGLGTFGSGNYFIGLERLHYLTVQADYLMRMWFTLEDGDGAGCRYDNFVVGDEGSSYALSYSMFYNDRPESPADNGFPATPPLLFGTLDNDPFGCAASRGYPGWFGADCAGYSLFADQVDWPINSTLVKPVHKFDMKVIRMKP